MWYASHPTAGWSTLHSIHAQYAFAPIEVRYSLLWRALDHIGKWCAKVRFQTATVLGRFTLGALRHPSGTVQYGYGTLEKSAWTHPKASVHYKTRGRTTPWLLLWCMRDVTMCASSPATRLTRGSTREDLSNVKSSRLVMDLDHAFAVAKCKVCMCQSRGSASGAHDCSWDAESYDLWPCVHIRSCLPGLSPAIP